MMMMGLHFMDEEPFHTVYMHALVRDKNGAKMSKSKGNVIDPLELIDEYGADALRFTLSIMAAQGRDVKLDPARIAGYRNFGTKLWNATRFAEMNGVARNDEFWLHDANLTINRWILTELTRAAREVTEGIASFRFNDAAGAAYRFVWNLFCDWYLELLKPVFMGDDEAAKAESQAVAAFVLDEIYKLLHPFMPFMTEELWAHTAGEGRERETLLCHASWPRAELPGCRGGRRDQLAGRSGQRHPLGAFRNECPAGGNRAAGDGRRQHGDARAAGAARIGDQAPGAGRRHRPCSPAAPKGSAQIVVNEATVCLPLGSLIDLKAEAARLQKEVAKVTEEIARILKKLSNEKFVANAKEEVVAAERQKLSDLQEAQDKLQAALSRLRDAD